jgi:hypothetical protein
MFGGPVHRSGRSAMAAPAGWARGRRGGTQLALARGLALGLGLAAGAAGAEETALDAPSAGDRPPAAAPTPEPGPVSLDRLLKLPAGSDYGAGERRGGRSRGEWASRFAGLRRSLAEEKKQLEAAEHERARIAGSVDQWLLGPPGATREDAPLDFRLRQEIRRHRDEIERLEGALRELDVEADLADVPPAWRE